MPRFVLPLANTGSLYSIAHIAWKQHIPVWEVQSLSHPEVVRTLADYQPDMLCVACFSLRVPSSLLALARLGGLNVHPSLLPTNRGPVPLFWTFREGNATTGVTIHLLSEGMDSGDILAQETLAVPEGVSYAELEALCAQRGAMLLAHTVWKWYKGKITPMPQDERYASYYSFPTEKDFIVDAALWSGRHLYNFIRGVGHWDQPITLVTGGQRVIVREVIAYSYRTATTRTETTAETNAKDATDRVSGKECGITIPCKDGYVSVVVDQSTL
jgi:methionyl-tRNA formyltransferase